MMREKIIDVLGGDPKEGDLVLTDRRVKLRRMSLVQYSNDVQELQLSDVKEVRVKDIGFEVPFIPYWLGIELALLLVFVGLTGSSIPLYNVFLWLIGFYTPNIVSHFLSVLVSAILVLGGSKLIPLFDVSMIEITSKKGSRVRYIANRSMKKMMVRFGEQILKRKKR